MCNYVILYIFATKMFSSFTELSKSKFEIDEKCNKREEKFVVKMFCLLLKQATEKYAQNDG